MSAPVYLPGVRVFTDGRELSDQYVLVAGGRIQAMASRALTPPSGAQELRGDFGVAPGFVDTHINGLRGLDVMRPGDVPALAREVVRDGVTGILPTTVAAPWSELLAALEAIGPAAPGGAHVLGIHAEGPFLSARRAGMFDPRNFRPFKLDDWRTLQTAAGGRIRVLTVAAELLTPDEVAALSGEGVVVSLGHSDATYARARSAVDAGARRATHTFNAMRGWHHREPGLVGAILNDGALHAELILDGHHVARPAARLLLNTRTTGGVLLVTDAVPPTGRPDGSYTWLGYRLTSEAGRITRADGTLAGSTLTMDQAVRNAVDQLGMSPARAIQLAAEAPLRSIGIRAGGHLRPGAAADLVILDNALRPVMTIVRGQVAWARSDLTVRAIETRHHCHAHVDHRTEECER